MSPDSDQSRIARLEARADAQDARTDRMERDVASFERRHEDDMRAFAPAVKDIGDMNKRMDSIEQAAREAAEKAEEKGRYKLTTIFTLSALTLTTLGLLFTVLTFAANH